MTLHETVENVKKAGVGTAIGLGIVVVLFIIVRLGLFIKDAVFPPKIEPPTLAYGKLPPVQFPETKSKAQLTFTINTVTGELPDLPDRLIIYPLVQYEPNFLNLEKVKTIVGSLGFVQEDGTVIPEKAIGDGIYEWQQTTGIKKKMVFNIVTFDFNMKSNYLSSLQYTSGHFISDEKSAVTTTTKFLGDIGLMPKDLDVNKSQNPPNDIRYITAPIKYDVNKETGQLIPAESLDRTKIFRVDLYQKDIEYELATGVNNNPTIFSTKSLKLPILYPDPPYSTMSFYIGSGDNAAEVVDADFVHKDVVVSGDTKATYPLITAKEAYEMLKQGQAYIAKYSGGNGEVPINKVYQAYYLGRNKQEYLMPIIVFEGANDFIAYVSAVRSEQIQTEGQTETQTQTQSQPQ